MRGEGVSLRPDPLYTRGHDRIDRRGAARGLPGRHRPLLPGDGACRSRSTRSRCSSSRLMHRELHLLPANVAMSAAFLLVGVGIGAYFLIRPVGRFIAGEISFADIEDALTSLPRRSALVMAICYVPMVALRLLSRRFGIDLDAMQEDPGCARSRRLVHRRHRVQRPADLLRRQRLSRPALRAPVPHPRRQPRTSSTAASAARSPSPCCSWPSPA